MIGLLSTTFGCSLVNLGCWNNGCFLQFHCVGVILATEPEGGLRDTVAFTCKYKDSRSRVYLGRTGVRDLEVVINVLNCLSSCSLRCSSTRSLNNSESPKSLLGVIRMGGGLYS